MAELKLVGTEQLRILIAFLVIGNAFRMAPANPDNACGADLYARLVLSQGLLSLVVLTAAMLLISVRLTARTDNDSSAAGWKRRVQLLLAVCLSAAAFLVAVSTFEDGILYRTGCAAPAGIGWRLLWLAMFVALVLPLHGYFAWVAVCGKARPWSAC